MNAIPVSAVSVAVATAVGWCADSGLGEGWLVEGGQWGRTREIIPIIRQGDDTGDAAAYCQATTAADGAWRATVMPALGAEAVGISVRPAEGAGYGPVVALGGNPGVGGFAVRSAAGDTLWQDRWAPWHAYAPYVVEIVVEGGKLRAQMFEWDGETLISQSPWVESFRAADSSEWMLGFYTNNGIGRFCQWEHAAEPLSPIVADAPNKLRLVSSEDSPWKIVGPGNWMWTSIEKNRIRQSAVVERSSAINTAITGGLRSWRARVKVDEGAGGAGMLFQTNSDATEGFIAWLGGQWGAGSLMLYRLPSEALWSGKQDNWHYNTEYLLRAETRPGQVRAQLLDVDGETIIQQTPWIDIDDEEAPAEGAIGFMTWKGTAEFWGFSEDTAVTSADREARPAVTSLGRNWIARGDGNWEWADNGRARLLQTTTPNRAVALNTEISGSLGTWRCRVKIGENANGAGLLFQAAKDLSQGFACLLDGAALKLDDLSGRTLWQDGDCSWSADTEYVLEGEVMVDRVAVRLLAADGQTTISECPAVYVSQANNDRIGHIGVLALGGPAEFWGWQLVE